MLGVVADGVRVPVDIVQLFCNYIVLCEFRAC